MPVHCRKHSYEVILPNLVEFDFAFRQKRFDEEGWVIAAFTHKKKARLKGYLSEHTPYHAILPNLVEFKIGENGMRKCLLQYFTKFGRIHFPKISPHNYKTLEDFNEVLKIIRHYKFLTNSF